MVRARVIMVRARVIVFRAIGLGFNTVTPVVPNDNSQSRITHTFVPMINGSCK
jgi:hypothetical protein